MEHHIKDFHYFLARKLANSSCTSLDNFTHPNSGVHFSQSFLEFLQHLLHSHLFNFPVCSYQSETDLAPKVRFNSAMKNALIINLNIVFVHLVKAFLQQGMGRIPDQAAVLKFRLLALVEPIELILRGSLDRPLILWVKVVISCGCLVRLIAIQGHSMHLEVLQQALERLDVDWIVSVDQIQECPTLRILQKWIGVRLC